jgi:hypothetical protein
MLSPSGRRPAARRDLARLAWTAETAFFALFNAATGQHSQATALLDWLAAHRTQLGSLPEQVNPAGMPAWIAPLSWTDAVTLLAQLAQAGHLPTIPMPSPGQQASSNWPESTAPEMTRCWNQACTSPENTEAAPSSWSALPAP